MTQHIMQQCDYSLSQRRRRCIVA